MAVCFWIGYLCSVVVGFDLVFLVYKLALNIRVLSCIFVAACF